MMDKIASIRFMMYFLHSRTLRINENILRGVQSRYASSDDSTAGKRRPAHNLLSALKGLKVESTLGQKIQKEQSSDFQNKFAPLSKKPIVLDALRKVVSSLPEHEKIEEELVSQLEKQDVQTMASEHGNAIHARPDRVREGTEQMEGSALLQRLRSVDTKENQVDNIRSLMSELKIQRKRGSRREGPSGKLKDDGHFKGAFGGHAELDGTEVEDLETDSGTESYKRRRKRSLFERYRLDIFETLHQEQRAEGLVKVDMKQNIWEVEEQRVLMSLISESISNGFDEMSMLTEEGKLWQFPINNEQGMETEQAVGFHEHIFLESHLEDFPSKGPVRHFMELVIHGLSMNPHLTVNQKKEHIEWFRNYFKDKEDILKETGAVEKAFSF